MPTRPKTCLMAACLALGACQDDRPPADPPADAAPAVARGSYDIDPETGETRARFTDADGRTTTLRSGEKVPVALPTGYTVYPGARVINNTRVEQRDGAIVLLELESAASVEDMVGFYRNEAEANGIEVGVELETGPTTTIGGMTPEGSSFSFTATRSEGLTEAQLAVGRGIE